MGDNDQILRSWSVFSCLYCELDREGQSYVLNAGKWYVLEKDFVKQVNKSFANAPLYRRSFRDYDEPNEPQYNKNLVNENSGRYFLMDCDFTYRGGKMEFCDIFSKDKELIHVNRYGGSATLSHLFYQGVASAEFFQMDSEYRKLIRDELTRQFQVFDPAQRLERDEYHVIFGIISRSDKPLTMPFFSRVGVRHAIHVCKGSVTEYHLRKSE